MSIRNDKTNYQDRGVDSWNGGTGAGFLWVKVLYILVILTLAFIWGHSLIPADLSSEESSRFVILINNFLASQGSSISVTDHIVRKTAHFLEYALLGSEIAMLKTVKTGGRYSENALTEKTVFRIPALSFPGNKLYGIPVLIWIGVPVIDEVIQYFTPGRACMWQDVLLDMCGFFVGYFLILFFITRLWRSKA